MIDLSEKRNQFGGRIVNRVNTPVEGLLQQFAAFSRRKTLKTENDVIGQHIPGVQVLQVFLDCVAVAFLGSLYSLGR